MATWNADQYLRFADERTRPCRDLAERISVTPVRRAIDLGCGPGNSTIVLAERWPEAELTGLDSSVDMIDAARQAGQSARWIVGDITTWAEGDDGLYDVVFSNAALQWVENHAEVLGRLMTHVAAGGALAVQMPGNYDGIAHRLMRELAASSAWRDRFPSDGVREWHVHDAPYYYDALAPHAERVDLWETEYVHVLPGPQAIVDWYKGTGLRPFLQALPTEADRERFAADYLEQIRPAYASRTDGRVLFPFRRIFMVAYRPT